MPTLTCPGTSSRGRARLAAGLFVSAALLSACGAKGKDDTAKDTTTTSAAASTTTTEATTTTSASTTAAGGTETIDAQVGDPWALDVALYRGKNGMRITFVCPAGGKPQQVWGAGTYTDDSSVCSAAVQSGLITVDKGGKATVEIAAGANSYDGGVANGITSIGYGSWSGSFTFPDAPPGSVTFGTDPASWSKSVQTLQLKKGESGTIECSSGGQAGPVWGSDPYTADSSICTAAVHHGLITRAEGGTVAFTVTAGADTYTGSTANGITTSSYGPYEPSFTFPSAG